MSLLASGKAAEWFAINLSRLEWLAHSPDPALAGRAFPFKAPLDSFGQLLPALLCPTIGGGRGAPQIAGVWLRRMGISGLVYPSARSNAGIRAQFGQVVDWYGWNFVDYRGAGEPTTTYAFDFSVGWPQYVQTWPDDYAENDQPLVYDSVQIEFEETGASKRSWAIRGLEERCQSPYQFLSLAWLMEQLFDKDDERVSNSLGLAYGFIQNLWRPDLPRDFVDALMGVESKRRRLIAFVQSDALDNDPKVRRSILSLLDRVAAGQ